MSSSGESGRRPLRSPLAAGPVTQIAPLRRSGGLLNHAVYDVLKQRLLEGRYPAGTRLPTEDLRIELGVSKQPVMEALRRLSSDGMVEIVPQVGCLVSGYDRHEIEDFYLGFGGFEGSIAGLAAHRRTHEQLTELDVISARIDALRTEPDPVVRSHRYRLWNRRFHHAIGAMVQSRVMTETSRRMWDLSDFLINTTGVPQPLSSAVDDRHADHERIRAALHAGDQAAAREEMSDTSSPPQRSSTPKPRRSGEQLSAPERDDLAVTTGANPADGYALGVSQEPSEPASSAVTALHRGGSRLNHAVYDQLKERLMEGRYTAGERLSTEALRTEFGVSKQPVMEAMRRLAGDGLIEIVPQVGSRVATFSPREVRDFFVMFGGFEGTIAGIAALRRTTPQLEELESISAQIGTLRSNPDSDHRAHGYRVLNRRFHHAIHEMAHSRIMAETSRRMWDLSDFLINTSDVPQPFSAALDDRHADHERILAALRAGDQETARAEMENHIVGTVDVIRADGEPMDAGH